MRRCPRCATIRSPRRSARPAALVRERREPKSSRERRPTSRGRHGPLDEGTLDRLRLDDARVEALARQLEAMAEVEPLEREAGSWTLPNGLRVSERRIPIGAVGANFEARPNVALDVAGPAPEEPQHRRSAHRRGGARHGDGARRRRARPALEAAGLPPGGGRARPLAGSRGRAAARLAAPARSRS